jgi:alpha-methylacyl-CoA racemase
MITLLDGVKVIDMAKMIPGDMTTMHLADLGADVIKVEEPPGGDYFRGLPPLWKGIVSTGYLGLNRNKRSIRLDFRSDEGKAILRRLIEVGDAFVEVSRPGSRKRDGLDYDSVREINPSIVYCSVSGYGQTGPYAGYPSHGWNMAALAGLAKVTHDGERPHITVPRVANEDAALHGALTIVAALLRRKTTGEGSFIDCSCWDAGVVMNTRTLEAALNDDRDESATVSTDLGARYDVYSTKDDSVILLCPIEKKFWVKFCAVIGREDLIDRGDWNNGRTMDYARGDTELYGIIAEVMRSRTKDEWVTALAEADVPFAPVLNPEDLLDDPHQKARQMLVSYEHPKLGTVWTTRFPAIVAGHSYDVRLPAPDFGQQSGDILGELGYSNDTIRQLRMDGVI